MQVEYESVSNAFVLRPVGDINVQSSPELRKILLEHYPGKGSIVVNLNQVRYMDSSGLATLIEGMQLARGGGGILILCEIREQMLLDLLEITHLLDAFPIFDTEAQAVR
ncbi:MAG TPA: anti-sigma factor antagonist [bacterium]|nr:anti-sigma factor antagonist [bacterium]HQO36766.1 anti-sigma factor antagonist [bacterium]HQP96954.1 anti-sigma factor antagonist [bacterium]